MSVIFFPYTGTLQGWYSGACLSTDTKPASPPADAALYEIDTGKNYRAEAGVWVEKKNAAYPFLVSGLVEASQLPQSGTDPWTYLTLGGDFSTSSATAVDVTGLAFTPAANLRYEFEANLMTRTATVTVGPRPGIAWPTGMIDGVVSIQQTSAAAGLVLQLGNVSAAVFAPVGGVPNTTQSWPAIIRGIAQAGATPSGTIKVQLGSETAGTNVTIKAGSFLKYRTY